MAKRFNSAQQILDKNAELAARLKVQEHAAAERLARLEAENRQLKDDNERLKSENSRYCESNVLLKEEVQWLKAQVFGRSSEKSSSEVSPEQRMLFNEAEVLAAIEAADAAHANRTTSIKSHDRQHTGGRKALPKNFPRKQIPHDIADSEKFCTHCAEHTPLERFGEESSERYGYEAPKVWVEQHIRPKYGCPKCHEGVKIAPPAPSILPKTMASPSLLAYLIASKFVDGLPLYRVTRQLERLGLDLSPARRALG